MCQAAHQWPPAPEEREAGSGALYEIPLWLDLLAFLLVTLDPMQAGIRLEFRRHRGIPAGEEAARTDVTLGALLALLVQEMEAALL